MAMATFSGEFSRTEKSAKHYWKAGLYIANFVFAFCLFRYGNLFSDTFTVPSSIIVISLFLYAGFKRLGSLSDGNRVKAYIKDHEAWALILLAIFLIVGTMSYVAYRSGIDAEGGQPQNNAPLESAGGRTPERLSDESSPPMMQETPSVSGSTTSNPTGQTSGLIPPSKRDNQLVKRRAIHHHHRR